MSGGELIDLGDIPIPPAFAAILNDPEQPNEIRERFLAGMRRRGFVPRRSGMADGRWAFELIPESVEDPATATELRAILAGPEEARS